MITDIEITKIKNITVSYKNISPNDPDEEFPGGYISVNKFTAGDGFEVTIGIEYGNKTDFPGHIILTDEQWEALKQAINKLYDNKELLDVN